MAGSIAYDCKKVFPHCAFTLDAAVVETNLPLMLAHLDEAHDRTGNANAGVTLNTALTYS